jgi:conjugative transfer pilus assembly protein TraH
VNILKQCKMGLLLMGVLGQPTFAGVAESLQQYANEIGYANVTGATAVMTQSGGYLSAGSGYIATPVKQAQFARFTAPNLSASCSGIDWTTGGMSFISGPQLTEFGQAIIQSAIPFAVDLALQTWAPQLAALKAKFEAIANAINSLNINSCQGAQLAVGAIAGSFMEGDGKKYLCQSYKAQNNKAAGWLGAQQGCSNTKDAAHANEQAKKDPNLENMIKQNRNIVWYQFMKNRFLKENTEIAEYLMSITGTIIYPEVDKEGRMKPDRRPPLMIDSKSAGFDELLFGSNANTTVEVYKCDSKGQEGCKNPTIGKLNIAKDKSVVKKMALILASIGQKFMSDSELSQAEKDVINGVDFPLSAILQTEIRAGWMPQYDLYAKIISHIVLTSYINQMLKQAQQSILRHDSASTDDDYKWILKNLKNARIVLVDQHQTRAYQALQQKSDMVMRSLQVEHSVVGNLSAQTQQNHSFGGL